MKKYFAKLLPIEGNINIGDKYYFIPANETLVCQDEREANNCNNNSLIKNNCKKLAHFLCSSDINQGDIITINENCNTSLMIGCKFSIYSINEHGIICGDLSFSHDEYNKVLGIISDTVTWIKEGDEFTQDEVKQKCEFYCGNTFSEYILKNIYKDRYSHYTYLIDWFDEYNERQYSCNVYLKEYFIKCPTCNTIHTSKS